MLITTLSYKDDREELNQGLLNMINYYKNRGINLGISEKINSRIHFIDLYSEDDYKINSCIKSLYYYIANIIYNAVLDDFREDELKHLDESNFFYLNYQEEEEIERSCYLALKGDEISEKNLYYLNVKNRVIDKIIICLNENFEFNLDGFIQFRKKDIYSDFRKVLDHVIEEFLIEKEYNEFISLLKYFVNMEEPKISEIDIIIRKDGSYKLTDERGKDIQDKILQLNTDILIGENASMDDIVISALITAAPRKIVIHCRENSLNPEIIETIEKIFEGRVDICDSCRLCKRIKRRY